MIWHSPVVRMRIFFTDFDPSDLYTSMFSSSFGGGSFFFDDDTGGMFWGHAS